jgi:D-glycero-D-manno-heptose 1,7-bisphosphate phosphatase
VGIDEVTLRRAVFVDRDGVLNEAVIRNGKPYPPSSIGELRLLPGVVDAVRLLRSAGFIVVVVTNQPDIARGTTAREVIDDINRSICDAIEPHDVRVCPHDDVDGCACRKPEPGLLTAAAETHRISLENSFMVGDRWRDIEAGRRAGCTTILIGDGYSERAVTADRQFSSLLDAARWICTRTDGESQRD